MFPFADWPVLSFGRSCRLVGLVLWSVLSFGRPCRLVGRVVLKMLPFAVCDRRVGDLQQAGCESLLGERCGDG